MKGRAISANSDATDPTETWAAKIAVMHNAAFPNTCGSVRSSC